MLRRCTRLLAVTFLAFLLGTGVATAQTVGSITLSPTRGPVGTTINVDGSCPPPHEAGDAVALYRVSDGALIDFEVQLGNPGEPTIDQATLVVRQQPVAPSPSPPTSPGAYEVRLFCGIGSSFGFPGDPDKPTLRSDADDIEPFTVLAVSYTFSPRSGPVGTTIAFSGSGCPPNPSPPQPGADLTFVVANGPGRAEIYESNPDGTFSGSYVVPPPRVGDESPDSSYDTFVFCTSTGEEKSTGTFTITAPPTSTTSSTSTTATTSGPLGGALRASRTSVPAGGSVTLSGGGFRPRSPVRLTLFSEPVALGSAVADAAGNIRKTVVIPQDTSAGVHRIVASGIGVNGQPRVLEVVITVTPAAALARTGGDQPVLPVLLVVFSGLVVALLLRTARKGPDRPLHGPGPG